ncbi:MAG TPA: DUF4838 domain-containing protein [Candidatus Hydrogenedentes bacterium]|nr:DUF4838 domain-containing protein [Candidatus Hydrogenedentota bacterium]
MRLLRATPIAVLITGFLVGCAHVPRRAWVTSSDYGGFHVVVADSASDSERFAAEEFKAYWLKVTGQDIPILDEPGGGIPVLIGRDAVPEDLLEEIELDGLGTDGLVIRTFPASDASGPRLVIVGGRERGTMYGVYTFLEDYLGVRWYTPKATYIPEGPPERFPGIKRRYVPPLLRRDGFTFMGYDRASADAFRPVQRISPYPKFGGYFVHSSFLLLRPDEYFPKHPEYYSEIDGERRAPVGIANFPDPVEMAKYPDKISQLCYSNPDVAQALVDVLVPMMRAEPDKQIWSVSQNDYFGNCQCSECRRIDEAEGTPMGSLLTGVNRVADAIRDEFPNNYIETLAYAYTRKAPKNMRPRDNVIISLCNIECDMSRAMSDPGSPVNRLFVEDLEAWSKIAPNLYFWDYPDSAHSIYTPFPCFHTMQENMQLWVEHGCTGAFMCGNGGTAVGLGDLRGYLLAKLVWDPYCDFEKHKREFIDFYYKEAGPYIREYLDLLTSTVINSGVTMGTLEPPNWIDYDLVVGAQEILNRAIAAAQSDEVRARVEAVQVQMQYAALTCRPRVRQTADAILLERPPSPTLEEFLGIMRRHWRGDPIYAHWGLPVDLVMAAVDGRTPPRRQRFELAILENDRYLVWVTPGHEGAVLRWRDKALDVELLRGYKYLDAFPTVWKEFTHTYPIGKPIAETFDVIRHTQDSITLRADLGSGLSVEKRLSLMDDVLELALTLKNNSDSAIIPAVKTVPEFYTQGPVHPEIWTQLGGKWRRQNPEAAPSRLELLDEVDYERLAARFPEAGVTLVSEFTPGEARPFLFAYRSEPPYNQLNLDVLPNQDPLEPGQSRSATIRYFLTKDKPERL